MNYRAADLKGYGTKPAVMDSTTTAQVNFANRRPTTHARSTRENGAQSLETEMQTKLHLAHISCAEDLPGRIAVDVAIRIHEVHVIGSVVILPLEFQGLGFGDLENFAK